MSEHELNEANRLFYSIEDCKDWIDKVMRMPVSHELQNELIAVLEKMRDEMEKEFYQL